jgi:hypothetical protein
MSAHLYGFLNVMNFFMRARIESKVFKKLLCRAHSTLTCRVFMDLPLSSKWRNRLLFKMSKQVLALQKLSIEVEGKLPWEPNLCRRC